MSVYADPVSESMILEAEACDEYLNTTKGNAGRAFRVEHYTASTDLDVYRSFRRLKPWEKKSATAQLVQIDAGAYDVWGVDGTGRLWAQNLDGTPDAWTSVDGGGHSIAEVAVGREWTWAVTTDGAALFAKLPYGWPGHGHTSWTRDTTMTFSWVDVGDREVWAVTRDNKIFHRPADGSGTWQSIDGSMARLWVGRDFVWGTDLNGDIAYRPILPPGDWTVVGNPHKIVQLSVGTSEVWGVNASGEIFRRSSAGLDEWEPVDGHLDSVAVGETYVWGTSRGTPLSRGFR